MSDSANPNGLNLKMKWKKLLHVHLMLASVFFALHSNGFWLHVLYQFTSLTELSFGANEFAETDHSANAHKDKLKH